MRPKVDPRLPVLVGGAQLSQRPADLHDALEPAALMAEVVEGAALDAKATGLLSRLDLVVAVKGAWRYPDPARLVAERVGSPHARTALTTDGGNTPQSLVNALAARIAGGELDVAAVTGAEVIWSRRRMRRDGIEVPSSMQAEGTAPDEVLGHDLQMSTAEERALGVDMPSTVYPIFESALRAARGESIEAHRDRIAALWARFNAVASANPHAWMRAPMTAAEIRDASPSNRMVGFPYTKAMNSNWDLDQAAAVIVCSAGAAEAAGVPRDRWVFLHAGTDAEDTALVSERGSLASSVAIEAAGRRLFALAGCGPDDLGPIDLYSCFPSAVQAAAAALGLAEDRDLTVTGGLTFAGGPLNNYVTHSIATTLGVLRERAGERGLVTANGGYLTKHALGIYSTDPPARPFASEHVDVYLSSRTAVFGHEGAATIEAYTVLHDHDGPQKAVVALLTEQGQRTWATSTEAATMAALVEQEHVGTAAEVRAGELSL